MTTDIRLANQLYEHAIEIKQAQAQRDQAFQAYENMYLLDWTDKPKGDNLKTTMSPDARNAVLGAVRLMTSTEPLFSVPGEKERRGDTEEKIERAANNIWQLAGRVAQNPIHYDAVLSAILYGETHIAITSTVDMAAHARKAKSGVMRADRIASLTPFLFESWNPRQGYAEFDALGLSAYYRLSKVRAREVRSRFGEWYKPEANLDDMVELGIFYDLENYAVWVDGTPIYTEKHGKPYIPISVTVTEGSMLFDKPENQRQPMLYTLRKSGLWERQNLMLTVLFTQVFGVGANAMFIHTAPQGNPDKRLDIDFSKPGGVVELQAGEQFQAMSNKGVIDPSITEAMNIAEQKTMESTIYRQALGEAVKGSPAFSTVALLSQSGRLPLISPQKRTGWGIANAMEIALYLYKMGGKNHEGIDLQPKDIPDNLMLEAALDVKLPQDKLQLANIAQMLVNARLTSKDWTRENILNIGQSSAMDEDIWSEQAAEGLFAQFMQQKMQEAQQKQAMQMQAQQQAMMPQQPEMTAGAGMPEGQGEMVQGGLPPQQAGMIPGEGQGAVPGMEGMA